MYEMRRDCILQELVQHNTLKVADLAQMLRVSVDTIRRDLKTLEIEGIVKCVHGGAVLTANDTVGSMYGDFQAREVKERRRKQELSQIALEEIQDGDVIFLNAGTTGTVFAETLIHTNLSITVVTNNIQVANVFLDSDNHNIEVHLLGGQLDFKEKCLYGYQCERELETYLPDIAFLSINAVNSAHGFTDFRLHEMGIMKILQKKAKRVVALMDSTKFGKESNKLLFRLSQVDVLYTDGDLDVDCEPYEEKGLTIRKAATENK